MGPAAIMSVCLEIQGVWPNLPPKSPLSHLYEPLLYVRAHSEPNLPLPRLGRPPRLTQDDLALVGQALCYHRHTTPSNLVPLIKDMGLVISESTLRRIVKKLGSNATSLRQNLL